MNQISQFKDFGIKVQNKGFIGDKIKIDRVLNRRIVVHDYKIEPSKFEEKGDGYRLTMQVEVNGQKHVIFTSSTALKEMIKQVPRERLPFETTIIKDNERYEFT